MIQDIDEWMTENDSNKTITNRKLTPNQRMFPKNFPMEEYEDDYDAEEWEDEEE